MTFVISTDPILSLQDAKALLDIANDQQAILVINSLSEKFKRFANRARINYSATAMVEKIKPYGGDTLHLHAPIGTGSTIVAEVVSGDQVEDTYTLADNELLYVTSDYASRIILVSGHWPDDTLNGTVNVTYKGGWATIPADVVQGAIMQGRVDIARMKGEVGVTSRGVAGESTQYQTTGLIRECLDLWAPYRVMI